MNPGEHTELPWEAYDCYDSDDDGWNIRGDLEGRVPSQVAQEMSKEDAAYIVQACNAYPALVEALRNIHGTLATTGDASVDIHGWRRVQEYARAALALAGEASS